MAWTIDELMLMTRDELCNLAGGIEETLAELEAGTGRKARGTHGA